MRFAITSPGRAKTLAKRLRAAAGPHGLDLTASKALEVAARMLGYANWHELVSTPPAAWPSPEDVECDRATVNARRADQVTALRWAGLTQDAAETVAVELQATNIRPQRDDAYVGEGDPVPNDASVPSPQPGMAIVASPRRRDILDTLEPDQVASIEAMRRRPGLIALCGDPVLGRSIVDAALGMPDIGKVADLAPTDGIAAPAGDPVSVSEREPTWQDGTESDPDAFHILIASLLRADTAHVVVDDVALSAQARYVRTLALCGSTTWAARMSCAAFEVPGRLLALGLEMDIVTDPEVVSGLVDLIPLPSLCQACRVPAPPPPGPVADLWARSGATGATTFRHDPAGCPACRDGVDGPGRHETLACVGVVVADASILDACASEGPMAGQDTWAARPGSLTAVEHALRRAFRGEVDIMDVARIVETDGLPARLGAQPGRARAILLDDWSEMRAASPEPVGPLDADEVSKHLGPVIQAAFAKARTRQAFGLDVDAGRRSGQATWRLWTAPDGSNDGITEGLRQAILQHRIQDAQVSSGWGEAVAAIVEKAVVSQGEDTDVLRVIVHPKKISLRPSTPVSAASPADDAPPFPYGALVESLAKLSRPAWIPMAAKGKGRPDGSRYYGSPWLPDGMDWPHDDTGAPASFVLQLDPADLPGEGGGILGDGRLLSYFQGSTASPDDAILLRIDAALPGGPRAAPDGVSVRPARPVNFVEKADHPHWEDLGGVKVGGSDLGEFVQEFGDSIGFGTSDRTGRTFKAGAEEIEAVRDAVMDLWGETIPTALARRMANVVCRGGDKVGGWPNWEQAPEWPEVDGKRFRHVYQIDYDDPFHGEGSPVYGVGNVFIDPAAPDVMAFTWACD